MSATIYTIGYQGRTVDELQLLLSEHRATLIDIRFRPASRNPDFSRARLLAHLKDRYRHVPYLGNVNYNNGGPIRLANELGGVKALSPLILAEINLMLMCVCEDWRTCHRRQVAEAVRRRYPECAIKHLVKTPPEMTELYDVALDATFEKWKREGPPFP